jgi:hypothetical protein
MQRILVCIDAMCREVSSYAATDTWDCDGTGRALEIDICERYRCAVIVQSWQLPWAIGCSTFRKLGNRSHGETMAVVN